MLIFAQTTQGSGGFVFTLACVSSTTPQLRLSFNNTDGGGTLHPLLFTMINFVGVNGFPGRASSCNHPSSASRPADDAYRILEIGSGAGSQPHLSALRSHRCFLLRRLHGAAPVSQENEAIGLTGASLRT